MKNVITIFKREFIGYFETPIAYVLMIVYLLLSGVFTFYIGMFYEAGQADLDAFFFWQPWLYIFIISAISMRLWSEEKRQGTIELLMTLPIKPESAVIGKFLAAWLFSILTVFLTFPYWITISYLGDPDHGKIFAGYLACIFLTGGYLAIGSCISAFTKNQVIAFVVSAMVCFIITLSGFNLVLNFFESLSFPQIMIDTIGSFSFLTHFEQMYKGVISLNNIIFSVGIIILWLFINILIINERGGK